jgi:hypothetical protein
MTPLTDAQVEAGLSREAQEILDSFYWRNGPCCAGCDWWQVVNTVTGCCIKAAPVSGGERLEMLGIGSASLSVGAGHPLTPRAHQCGDFRDQFDWSTLPLAYRKRVGAPV